MVHERFFAQLYIYLHCSEFEEQGKTYGIVKCRSYIFEPRNRIDRIRSLFLRAWRGAVHGLINQNRRQM